MIRLKRIYDPPMAEDGCRILVDRLWPRGMKKDQAQIDHWFKDIAPSPELREWFCHDSDKWKIFYGGYLKELSEKQESAKKILRLEKENHTITLLYAAKDREHNHAIVLRDFLKDQSTHNTNEN